MSLLTFTFLNNYPFFLDIRAINGKKKKGNANPNNPGQPSRIYNRVPIPKKATGNDNAEKAL
jgi:hypothetical protein